MDTESPDHPASGTRPAPPTTTVGRAVPPSFIGPEHIYKAIGLFFLFLIFYAHFRPLSRVLLIVYAAVTLAIAMNVIVGLVPRHRKLVSGVLGVTIFATLGVSLWLAIPMLTGQVRGLAGEVPRLRARLEVWSEWLREQTGLNIDLFGLETQQFVTNMIADAEVIGTATGVVEAVFLPLVILIGAIYAVAKPNDRLLSPLLHVVPPDRRESFRRLFELLGKRLRGWVKGTLLAMLAVGLLTGIGLWIIGVRYVFLLAVVSGLLEIIPIIGPWVAGGLAVTVAFVDDPSKAIWVALLMLAIQQLESNVITPVVMSQAAEVHPFVTLFALFFFGSLFGFLGVILALPLVLLVWTTIEVLWVERAIASDGDRIEPLVREG